MPGAHCIEEVERLAAAHLADYDPVGRHAQRVVDEHLDADCALALGVRRAAFERDAVGQVAPQVELGLVFDGDDPLVGRDVAREHAHEGGLARAGAAGDQDVEPSLDRCLEERDDRVWQESRPLERLEGGKTIRRVPADGHAHRPGRGRERGVETAAFRQSQCDHRAGPVEACAACAVGVPVHEVGERVFVVERRRHRLAASLAEHEARPRAVDANLFDVRIG